MTHTGSIQAGSITLSKHQEKFQLNLTLTSGEVLIYGDTVYLSANQVVSKWDAAVNATEFPIGIVTKGAADASLVTIATFFQRTLKAHNANGGTVAAGDFMNAVGTVDAGGLPDYDVAVADDFGPATEVLGDWATAIVINGGLTDVDILVGILRVPVRPTPVVD